MNFLANPIFSISLQVDNWPKETIELGNNHTLSERWDSSSNLSDFRVCLDGKVYIHDYAI